MFQNVKSKIQTLLFLPGSVHKPEKNKICHRPVKAPCISSSPTFESLEKIYAPENSHGIWKSPNWKGTSSSIHLHFSGAILVFFTYTPWNYHNPQKMMVSNRNLPFQGFFFQFQGGKFSVPNLASRLHEPPLGCPVGSAGNRLGQ